MTTCPVCGLLYAVHIEHVYTCPNGHTWKWEHEGTITGRLHREPPQRQVTPRDVVPHYDAAVARCLREHRLPPARIPCVECQQKSVQS